MKLLTLLLVIKKVFSLDLINAKTLGGWNFHDVVNHLYQNGYNGGHNTPGDTRRFQLDQQQQFTQQQLQQPNLGVPNIPDGIRQSNQTCCPRGDCPKPCMNLLPYYPVQQVPIPLPIVPMRAYYEKVVHDHPPIWKIKDFLKKDEDENETSSDVELDCSDSEESSSVD